MANGVAGAPQGNRNGAKGKDWQDALRKAMIQYESKERGVEQGQALYRIATKVVEQAIDGDPVAWQEIGNRLDGKPAQSVQLSGDEDKPLFTAIKMLVINNPNQIKDLATIEGEIVGGEGVQSLGESSQDERVTLPRSVIPETHPALNEVSPVSKVEANIPVSQLPVDFDANSV